MAANLLNRCPSCMNNLVRHICEFTCSPRQSNFVKVIQTDVNPETNSELSVNSKVNLNNLWVSTSTGTYVNEIDVHITEQYTSGTFNSCINVQFPSSGQLALDLMCGDWGAARCSATRWFSYMGNADGNVFIPFQINYRNHNSSATVDGITPMDPRVVPCNESVDVRNMRIFSWWHFWLTFELSKQGKKPACSCVDCASSCPKPPPPEPIPQRFLIWSLDGYAVVMFFIFLVGSSMFVIGTGWCSNVEGMSKSITGLSLFITWLIPTTLLKENPINCKLKIAQNPLKMAAKSFQLFPFRKL